AFVDLIFIKQVRKIENTRRKNFERGDEKNVLMVRPEGLEPPRFYPADPKSAASANSAMAARVLFCHSFHARYATTAGNWRCPRKSYFGRAAVPFTVKTTSDFAWVSSGCAPPTANEYFPARTDRLPWS